MIKLYTEAEVCAMLDLSPSQLKEKRDRGEISCFHVHAKVYKYSDDHVLDYLKSREKKAKRIPCEDSPSSLNIKDTGMLPIMTESEADAAQRAIKSARKTMKPTSSLQPLRSSVRNQQPESRIN